MEVKGANGFDYGSENWYFHVKSDLSRLSCKLSELDNTLYKNEKWEGIFVMHMDDFLFAGTDYFNVYYWSHCQKI